MKMVNRFAVNVINRGKIDCRVDVKKQTKNEITKNWIC